MLNLRIIEPSQKSNICNMHMNRTVNQSILDQIKEFLLKELQLGEIWDFNESKFIQENKLFQPIS